jgi:lipoyl(octanoyl) transferase
MCPKLDAILFEAAQPVPFLLGWEAQRSLQQRLLLDPEGPEAVLLLEH